MDRTISRLPAVAAHDPLERARSEICAALVLVTGPHLEIAPATTPSETGS